MPPCKRRPNDLKHGSVEGRRCAACKRDDREERKKENRCTANNTCGHPPKNGSLCQHHHGKKTEQQMKRRVQRRNNGAAPLQIDPTLTIPQATENEPPTGLPSWDMVIWVTVPDNPAFDMSNTLAIQLFPDDHVALRYDPWLKEASSSDLGEAAVVSRDGGFYLHQGLVTMCAVKSMSAFDVLMQTWDWLKKQLQSRSLHVSCQVSADQPKSTVVFIHWTTEEPEDMTLEAAYAAIRMLKHIHGAKFRLYPSESESWQERSKVGDIRALDDMARSAPLEYSYRPITCYGHGPCQLQGHEKTILKRTHSGSSKHVEVLMTREWRKLTCTLELPSQAPSSAKSKKRKYPDHQIHWFHQEFVPELHRCEFRVFIATRPDAKGIRGQRGHIVAMAKTAWDRETGALASKAVEADDFKHYNNGSLTETDLQRFSLFIFDKLRSRLDYLVSFESLEVGVRLDIGVAKDARGEDRFFVNEITRWYGAHYFSHTICPEPKTQICKAFASAFSRYVQHSMPEIYQ